MKEELMQRRFSEQLFHTNEYEKAIGYSFTNKEILFLSLTHSSYANENKREKLISNERLEFLGDSVLNLIISEWLYSNDRILPEGDMTKIRAHIICESSLIQCAQKLNIGNMLIFGKGEESTGGRTRGSILADAFEALLGAIYIDGGMKPARDFILYQMKGIMEDAMNGIAFHDYKTKLQEMVHKNSENRITYEILAQEGPDHNRTFVSQVTIADKILGIGKGRSKKEAEQNAAKEAISHYG